MFAKRTEARTAASNGVVQVGILYFPILQSFVSDAGRRIETRRATNLKYGFDLKVFIDSEPSSKNTQTLREYRLDKYVYTGKLGCAYLAPKTRVLLRKTPSSTRRYRPAGNVDKAIKRQT